MEARQMFYAHLVGGETEPRALVTCPAEASGPLGLLFLAVEAWGPCF